MKKFYLVVVALAGLVASAFSAPVLMEGIAAIVDGKPIMRSEFLNNLYHFQETPEGAAMTEEQQKQYVLDKLIEEKVLLSRIDRDSIVVSDAEIDQRVTAHLSQLAASQNVNMATLEKAIRSQLGVSMAQYREQLAKQIRSHVETQRVRQRHVGAVSPTKKEVDFFYQTYKDSLPRQYNCVQLSHIQLKIEPDSAIVDSVKRLAENLVDSLNLGIKFELLAKNHSQDSSAEKGGDLGYYRRGLLDPAFERTLDLLKNGQYSSTPVKTDRGWHIVRVIGRKEDGVRSAHILLRTIPTAADSARVLQLADSLRASIKTKDDFSAAAKKFSTDKSSNFAGGLLGWYQKNEMEPAYVDPVSNLNVGEVSEPVEIDGSYHLFRLDDSRQIRELTLEEDYGKIEAMAANHLENEKLNALLKKWREEVHIEIRMTE
ncbi:periplasmic chaperone for outer membrane proteins SurA [Fibrobacter sp. UWCM]|jgi:peptidyl-prolyl cis-trans isomerase SurA|uniref:peptidylprolyl isomerase n=1 Tax=Fibrobacter sp. UWCM TaxID=1896208 RepID=UPI00091E59AD|nr:peptidylprolyl isomerase [Fibrobacter sp. UWCM]MBO6136072.1 peptidylprolyl isomerase [Fibrobacter sp.]SHG46590.1 periplasmic chaperone for outer membrane proteins SurA [Fibrobacter sp. UWCM]